MATLIDHTRRTRTDSVDVETLTGFMVTALMRATKHRPSNIQRYCESSVRAAIRRGGRTDAGQELRMSEAERTTWEAAHPLPE